jgi:hypothetical protein
MLISVFSLAKDKAPRDWKTGTLFDMTSEKGSRLVGNYSANNGTATAHSTSGEMMRLITPLNPAT